MHAAATARDISAKTGLGLRPPMYAMARRGDIPVDWLELITENFMVPGGQPLAVLEDLRRHYPIAFHGVSLNLGGTELLDLDYLRELKRLTTTFEPMIVSDHLCWTRHGGLHLHDLLPLPYDEGVIDHVARRIVEVQDILGRQILIENLSSYVEFNWSDMPEWEFLRSVAERSDCLILLDLNNIVVNAKNHDFEPQQYMQAMPADRIAQYHVAGHSLSGTLRIDTHDKPVSDQVISLYADAKERFGAVPVCLERDEDIPEIDELLRELAWITDTAAECRT